MNIKVEKALSNWTIKKLLFWSVQFIDHPKDYFLLTVATFFTLVLKLSIFSSFKKIKIKVGKGWKSIE
jgi:hypothetical protein